MLGMCANKLNLQIMHEGGIYQKPVVEIFFTNMTFLYNTMYIHIAKSAFVHIHMCVSNDSEYVYVQVHCSNCTLQQEAMVG